MRYYTSLFTLKTWNEFKSHGGTISGQSEARHSRSEKLNVGDRLLCYLVGAGRWIAVLEVTGKAFLDFEESHRIWADGLYPSRIPVRIVIECDPEVAPDVKPAIDTFDVMVDIKPSNWGNLFMGALNQWSSTDGNRVERMLQEALTRSTKRPLPARTFSVAKYRAVSTETDVLVTLPAETENPPEPEGSDRTETEHTKVQMILSQIGSAMGFKVHIPANDRNRTFNGQRISEVVPIVEQLNLGLIPSMMRVIKNIDVLWIEDDAVLGAFEVESTTSIYSGILRMADLLSLQPNFQISCYLVAPDNREAEVFNQVNRPVFTKMKRPFRESCRFIPFSSLTELDPSGLTGFKHQKISYIEEEFSVSLIPTDM